MNAIEIQYGQTLLAVYNQKSDFFFYSCTLSKRKLDRNGAVLFYYTQKTTINAFLLQMKIVKLYQ